MTLTGVDISGAMVERAARRAARAGLSERVRFEVGDVAALPLSDEEFDGVVIPFRFVSGIMSACQRYSIRR